MRYGARRTMTITLAMMASLVLTGTAAAQGHTSMHTESRMNGHHVSVHTTGEVRFTDDDRDVAYMEPGARMTIEEEVSGQPDRRVEYRNAGGGVQRRYFRDGEEVRPNADDEAWIRRALMHPIRESGVNAGPRALRIYRRGGVNAVLDEIRLIGSDGVKKAYYTALLGQPLRPGETARVLRDAGDRIGSDGEKHRTLAVLLERRSIAAEEMVAMLDAASRIGSDGDKSRLLMAAASRYPLDDASVRAAFFRTAATIGSDGDKSRVLMEALSRGNVRRDAVVDAIRTARTIGSDGDKSRVLMSVPEEFLGDRAVRSIFVQAMQGIGSDGDRSRVAMFLARSVS
jgi:hypothetical protein